MAVPPKDALYCPILEIATEIDEPWSRAQFTKAIGNRLSLTTEDKAERIPSGGQRIYDRVDWALHDLRLAGLVERPSRGRFRITSAGREYLKANSGKIITSDLSKLATQQELGDANGPPSTLTTRSVTHITDDEDASPEDQIDIAHCELQKKLIDDLLGSISDISSDAFERLVVKLLEKMDYGKGEVVGRSGDGGIDGIITRDPLGLEKVYIQAKRWKDASAVDPDKISAFSGNLDRRGATKGVFVTRSRFTSGARQAADEISGGGKFIRLIDGPELAKLMIAHEVGVITQKTYKIQALDENYFAEEL